MSPKKSGRKRLLRPLWQRLYGLFRKFTRLPEEDTVSDEPIDFSAPSVPYYTNLAERFNLARIVLYMVLFVFVVVTVVSSRHLITYENLYYLVKDVSAATLTAQSRADYLSYPMSGTSADFALYRGGLTVVGGQEITVLSASGKQTLSENVSLSDPQVRAGERYFLTFSRGENDFSLYNAFVRVHREDTDYPIYDACMARDGAYAVLTRSADYKSEVIFYNEDMNKVAVIHLGGYVTAMSISPDGKTLATLSVTSEDSGYVTKLTLMRRGASKPVEREVLHSGVTALTAAFVSDERLVVISEEGLTVFDTDGDAVSEVSFEGDELLLSTAQDGYTALLFGSAGNLSENVLKVFDKNGKMVYNVGMTSVSNAQELLLSGSDVYIRLNERIMLVSDQGKRISEAEIHRDTVALLLDSDGGLIACRLVYARRMESSDFSVLS